MADDPSNKKVEKNTLHIIDNLYEIRSGQQKLVIKLMENYEIRATEIIDAKKSGKTPKYDFDKLREEYEKNLALFKSEVDATNKLIDKTARDLSNRLLKYDTEKRPGGRPEGSVTDARNYNIKLMYHTLLYGATYEDENGEIHSQYRHYDTRTKEDLSVWEIYLTIAEYYPELQPATIKDIVNKKTP